MFRKLLALFMLGAMSIPMRDTHAAARCPSSVQPSIETAVAYADRGDRCEGLYQQPVAASAGLKIIGVHRNPPSFPAGSRTPLLVSAAAPQAKDINLRVLSRQPQKYYRMDARLGLASKFVWKRDIINDARVGLSQFDVAALMCEGSCESRTPLIYPVSITEEVAAPVQGVTIWVRAAVNLKKLLITIEDEGIPLPNLNGRNVLERGDLPGGIAKDIFLAIPLGDYRLRALAIPSGTNVPDEVRATLILR